MGHCVRAGLSEGNNPFSTSPIVDKIEPSWTEGYVHLTPTMQVKPASPSRRACVPYTPAPPPPPPLPAGFGGLAGLSDACLESLGRSCGATLSRLFIAGLKGTGVTLQVGARARPAASRMHASMRHARIHAWAGLVGIRLAQKSPSVKLIWPPWQRLAVLTAACNLGMQAPQTPEQKHPDQTFHTGLAYEQT